jgi:hypothetical protein
MPGVNSKLERLTERERSRLLSEYALLPRNVKTGQILSGYLRDLAYKWLVSRQFIKDLVEAEREKKHA